MKYLLHFLIFFIICADVLISQSTQTVTEVYHEIDSFNFPKVITSIESLRATLPKRVDTVATAYGDLNKDGLLDLVVVVSLPYTTDYPDDMPYDGDAAVPLAVYLGQKNGYSLLSQSKM
jgi:hypothetical protein